MVVADVVAGLTIASVPLAFWFGSLSAVHALAAGFLAQTAFVFFDGAAFGALPAIVGRDRIGQANSALWGFGSLLDLGVPMLAGVLLAVVHPATLLGIDALSFLLSAACVASIRTRLSPERSGVPPLRPRVLLAEVAVGLRFLFRHAGVRSQTVVGFLLSLSGAGFMSLSVPYADVVLGVGTSGWRFGLVFAAWGVGGILVAVLTPRLLRVTSPNRLSLLWLPVAGVAGVVAFNAAGRAHDRCAADYCPQYVRDSDITQMRAWLVVTAVAGAATIGFFTLAVLSISKPVNEKVVAGVKPYVGPGAAGVVGTF